MREREGTVPEMLRASRPVLLLVVTALFWTAVPTTPAAAKDMNGKFGLGYVMTLGGVSGASFRYWVTRYVGIEATIGVSLINRQQLRALTEIYTALGVHYAFAQSRYANLSIAARLDFGIRTLPTQSQITVAVGDAISTTGSSVTPEADDVTWQINVEIPFVAEFFFSDNFSINLAMGLLLVFVPSTGAVFFNDDLGTTSRPQEIGIGLGAGGLFGSAGFTYYF